MHLDQVKVGVHEFADGRPHYAWLPLAGRAAAGSVGGEVRIFDLHCHENSEVQCAAAHRASVPWLICQPCCRCTCACNGERMSAKQMLRPRPSSHSRCVIACVHESAVCKAWALLPSHTFRMHVEDLVLNCRWTFRVSVCR